jgi:limonene-1,2-epoxide hydrolase
MFVMDCSKEIDLACNLNKSKMQPKQILLAWIEAFNKADVNGLATLYRDDAINHQVANEPVQGKDSIAKMFEQEFAAAEMVCIPENIFEDGEWVIMEWKDPKGLRGCGFFQIVDNKIKLQRGYWDRLSFMKLYQNDLPAAR